jgi:carboxyl-terminal processing protease
MYKIGSRTINTFGNKVLLVICLVVVLTFQVVAPVAASNADRGTSRQQFLESLKILGSVYERVYYNYVDDVDAYNLLEAGINGMLDYLDEHSQYLPPVNYEDLMMSTEGEFGGLGISISTRDHFPTVVSPIEGTPAFLMGVQGGDQIIEIEGESTLDFTSTDAVKLLRGEPGTRVTITIQRAGTEEPFPLTITRDIIKVDSVPYAFMIDDIGYIRIQNFARSTADEMREKLSELRSQGARGLILDLRWNPGGLLEAANAVSEMFLDEGDLIVYTKGRLRQQNRSYFSEKSHQDAGGLPTIVMVNGSSASASEIVSAALQDHDKGVVVGKTSFGKGSVQTVFPLTEDRALKLTTAKYYTPSGRSIHKDRHLDGADFDMTDTAVDGPVEDVEIKREEKEEFKTDSGRTIYGGGGVTPDIEIDQPYLSDFEVALERDGALFSFATEWAASHDVADQMQVDDEIRTSFSTFLKEREKIEEYLGVYDLAMSDSLLDANQAYIDRGIRREMMRRVKGAEAAYRVAIEDDVQLLEVIKLFERARTLEDLMAIADEWQGERLTSIDAAEEEPIAQ